MPTGGATLVGMTAVLDGPLRTPAATAPTAPALAGLNVPALTAPEPTVPAPADGGPAVAGAPLPEPAVSEATVVGAAVSGVATVGTNVSEAAVPRATVRGAIVPEATVVEATLVEATLVAPSIAAPIGPAPRLRPARCRPAAAGTSPGTGAPRVPRLPDHPDARVVVVRALRLACEVLDGRRPFAHLAAHAEPVVLRYWRAAAATRRSASPTRIGHPHLQHPCDGAAEVATALVVGGRPRALAARFDLVDGKWRWTAVRLG